jgi:hypothetical protein
MHTAEKLRLWHFQQYATLHLWMLSQSFGMAHKLGYKNKQWVISNSVLWFIGCTVLYGVLYAKISGWLFGALLTLYSIWKYGLTPVFSFVHVEFHSTRFHHIQYNFTFYHWNQLIYSIAFSTWQLSLCSFPLVRRPPFEYGVANLTYSHWIGCWLSL